MGCGASNAAVNKTPEQHVIESREERRAANMAQERLRRHLEDAYHGARDAAGNVRFITAKNDLGHCLEPGLIAVNLENLNVTDEVLQKLCTLLEPVAHKLQSLNLDNNNFGMEGAKQLASLLTKAGKLSWVGLAGLDRDEAEACSASFFLATQKNLAEQPRPLWCGTAANRALLGVSAD